MAIHVPSRAISLALLTALAGLSGCANMMTINRNTELTGGGRAIHLDAPQRVAYTSKDGMLCAEPSPDALQAYAASLGISLSAPSSYSAAIANSLSGSSSSIGLRTQSITLMRDHLYRICEAYYNNQINEGDVISLMQRSQDLTLGILAIEQLTGAVVARQVVLTPGAETNASAGVRSGEEGLKAAQKTEEEKKAALTTATAARDKQKGAVTAVGTDVATKKSAAAPALATIDALKPLTAAAQTAVNKSNDALGVATGKRIKQKAAFDATTKALEAAKTKQDKKEIDRLTKQQAADQAQLENDEAALAAATKAQGDEAAKLKDLQAQLKKASEDATITDYNKATASQKTQQETLTKNEDAVKAATAAVTAAHANMEKKQAELHSAIASASGRASGSGSFSTDDYRNNVNKDTIASIADTTRSIVETVVYKGRLTEACSNMMTAYARNPEYAKGMKDMMSVCDRVFAAAIEGYLIGVKAGTPKPPAYPASQGIPYPTTVEVVPEPQTRTLGQRGGSGPLLRRSLAPSLKSD